ncbi:type II toxin-antitoxin system RelE/ParE family toxin [Owenweeksia hongkongensis]|uniref:type II toxin-antitoxin system RelE/ParE family toxin n=1 Tax=Owenweeksia hongkongensis TaxID=253245 RepID=UPI003A8E7E4C
MATREVRWTLRSIKDKMLIYEYWLERNQSDAYPRKLERLFNKSMSITAKFPLAGKPTELENIRYRLVKDYKIFYRINDKTIEVLTVWYSRQNPKELRI